MMAGVNVPSGEVQETYLVCWKDKIQKRIGPGTDWEQMKRVRAE
jgi:hypothetical protein